MRDLVTVSIATPFPDMAHIGDVVIDPRVVACSFETQAGGWGRGRVGLTPDGYGGVMAALPEPVEAPENAHVQFRLGGSVVYEGVIVRVSPNRTGFECEGYGLWASRWATVDVGGATPVTSGVIVREALRGVPWLATGTITDPGVYHAWDEVQYQKAGAVIDQMASEGDGNTPWMYRVYEDRLASFTPKVPADVADITLSYDPDMMQVGWEYERLDAVRILYTERDGTERLSPWFYRGGVDQSSAYLRRETLTGSGSSSGAIATAQTYLTQHSSVGLSGTVAFTDWQHLGVRYGDTYELLGYGRGIVERTSVDMMAGTTQLALGEPSRSSASGFLNALAASVEALRQNRNVVTKAKGV
jgi:hypothetical protein